jgi:hypothetical protein
MRGYSFTRRCSADVAGAVDAERAFRRGVEAPRGDLAAATVACAVGAFAELRQRSLDSLLKRLELLGDPHIGEAVDRLARAVADSLPERDAAGVLRRLCQFLDLRVNLGQPLAQRRLDRLQVKVCGYFVALKSSWLESQPSLPKVNFISPVTLRLVASPTTFS